MHISANGRVSMCCIDVETENGYGNIENESIMDIYNCELIKEDRHKHLIGQRKKIKICNNCDQPESVSKNCIDNLDINVPILENRHFKINKHIENII